ncbi:MAG TPA: sigma-70 family RNA polymerase sigma factor [Candidatus Angelobacter sp.]|jgi:RNA polymerase sigma-70 factor (ECF subfamily)|nr:sigma-70 family RNA polymerase sigma factor [Candidatus Angelobacter sp.]
MKSDESLMLDFQRGSQEAFDELYARYRGPLFGFFSRRLDDLARAEDLVQETFVAVIRATARYEPRSLLRTYLYGIAMNLLRAERRKPAMNEPQEGIEDRGADTALEKVLQVKQALAQLEAGEREILMLREYEQLEYAEIAELMRLPINTVRSRLFRARMSLKEVLGREVPSAARKHQSDRQKVGE